MDELPVRILQDDGIVPGVSVKAQVRRLESSAVRTALQVVAQDRVRTDPLGLPGVVVPGAVVVEACLVELLGVEEIRLGVAGVGVQALLEPQLARREVLVVLQDLPGGVGGVVGALQVVGVVVEDVGGAGG